MIAAIYKWLLRIGKVAGPIAFLFAVPYGIWEYSEKKQADRVEQSLKLFDKYNSSPFTEYRRKIAMTMASNKQALLNAAKDEKELTATVVAMVEREIEPELWLIMDFFDGVAVCIVGGLCDATTVDHLFRERARDFHITFYQYIRAQRRGPTSTFGLGLESIATQGRTPPSR